MLPTLNLAFGRRNQFCLRTRVVQRFTRFGHLNLFETVRHQNRDPLSFQFILHKYLLPVGLVSAQFEVSVTVITCGIADNKNVPDILSMIAKYGYQSLFAAMFMESIGLPVPAALALLAAGAASASGALNPAMAAGVAVVAMLTGDIILYVAGRSMGWSLLGFLCGLSLSPEVCILRAAKWFYKRGRVTLLFAKFVPGVGSMAPPLAGSMNMRPAQFLRFDLGGALLYTLAYGALGYLFRDVFRIIAGGLQAFSRVVGWVIFVGVIVFVCYRAWLYGRYRLTRFVRRVPVGDVEARLKLEGAPDIIIADVRSHGYYDQDEQRVQGSIRIEPNNLEAFIETLPKDTPIYLYCT